MASCGSRIRIHLIAGARPNFMKVAPLWHALKAHAHRFSVALVHTGQHFDAEMSDVFLRELGLPKPAHMLGSGSGSHAVQTAAVMEGYERTCRIDRPDWVIVVGDVNSTLACALVAKKLKLQLAHLEAGLRSFDTTMPEEINRVVTDALADLLWTPSLDGDENLSREGIPQHRIERVGNIMIDTYEMLRDRIQAQNAAAKRKLPVRGYAVITMHRPSNVDNARQLTSIVDTICALARRLPIVFALHPRTKLRLQDNGLLDRTEFVPQLSVTPPLGYLEFMSLVGDARFLLTDSGGVQEESTYLGVPCLTLRDSTERPVTVKEGSNRLVSLETLESAVETVLQGPMRIGRRPEFWDGQTAGRVLASLERHAGASA